MRYTNCECHVSPWRKLCSCRHIRNTPARPLINNIEPGMLAHRIPTSVYISADLVRPSRDEQPNRRDRAFHWAASSKPPTLTGTTLPDSDQPALRLPRTTRNKSPSRLYPYLRQMSTNATLALHVFIGRRKKGQRRKSRQRIHLSCQAFTPSGPIYQNDACNAWHDGSDGEGETNPERNRAEERNEQEEQKKNTAIRLLGGFAIRPPLPCRS